MKALLTQTIACLLVPIASFASAADIRIVSSDAPLNTVVIQGEILRGDSERFLDVIRTEKVGAVLLESPGGSLLDGLIIGRAIRSAGFTTNVAPETACASACALAWLAGATRFMHPSALVGFHAAYIEENGQVSESGVGNALVGAYINELGLGFDAVVFIASAAPSEMNWLNAAKAQKVGIELILTEDSVPEETNERETALKLPRGFRWIVLESAKAQALLKTAKHADQIVKTQNGYFASILGPFEVSVAENLRVVEQFIPSDAYLSSGNGFLFSVSK